MERIQTQDISDEFIGEGELNLPLVESSSVPKHLLLPAPPAPKGLLSARPTPILLEAKTLAVRIEKIRGKYPRFVQQLMEAGINLYYPEYKHILEFLEQMMEAGIDFHVYSWDTDYDTDKLRDIREKLDCGYVIHQPKDAPPYTEIFWPRESDLTIFHLKIEDSELVIGYSIESPEALTSVFKNPKDVFTSQSSSPEEEIVWITGLLAMTEKDGKIKYGFTLSNLLLFLRSFYLMYLHYTAFRAKSERNAYMMMKGRYLDQIADALGVLEIINVNKSDLRDPNEEPTDTSATGTLVDERGLGDPSEEPSDCHKRINAVRLLPGYFWRTRDNSSSSDDDSFIVDVSLGRLRLNSPETRIALSEIGENPISAIEKMLEKKRKKEP